MSPTNAPFRVRPALCEDLALPCLVRHGRPQHSGGKALQPHWARERAREAELRLARCCESRACAGAHPKALTRRPTSHT